MKTNASKTMLLFTAAIIFSPLTINQIQAAAGRLDRALSFTVTRSDDRNASCIPGDCSLREAVEAANSSATDDTINFAPDLRTVTLDSEIVINNAGALTINGPGASALTIDGGPGTNRIFYTNQAIVNISGVTLTGGNGTGANYSSHGGAIYEYLGSLTLDSVCVTGNTAAGFGGGAAFWGRITSHTGILNSTFSYNTAGQGGGGFSTIESFYLTVVNSTITSNDAQHSGGGFDSSEDTFTTLRNVTITNNTARVGGGINVDGGDLNFGNTIVAGNRATLTNAPPEINSDCLCTSVTSAGTNLVGDSPGDSMNTGTIHLAYRPTDVLDTDPLLGSLRNYGGTTPTHALKVRSPAIDKGLNALAVDPSSGRKLSFDQRGSGYPRILAGYGIDLATVDIGAFEFAPNGDEANTYDISFNNDAIADNATAVLVANIEELYTAVNDPQNAGSQIVIAPGVYMLSVNDPMGAPRPNGGRLELQQDMSLQGVVGVRGAVIIDAMNLPSSSYAGAVPNTGAIRIGKGTNSIEWLTITGAVNGGAGIIVHLSAPGTTHARVAHIASVGPDRNNRGIDVRNVNATSTAYLIDADIVDNDLVDSRFEGIRIINLQDANGGVITARLSGNRSHGNRDGLLIVNNKSSFGSISVTSTGDQFYQNASGTIILGGYSTGSTPANGNVVSFDAHGTSFVDNNAISNLDVGGLIIIGGENTSFPNGTSNNNVKVSLDGCRLANNQSTDLEGIGARSNPETIGSPGMNNHVTIVRPPFVNRMVQLFINSIPDLPGLNNTVTVRDR